MSRICLNIRFLSAQALESRIRPKEFPLGESLSRSTRSWSRTIILRRKVSSTMREHRRMIVEGIHYLFSDVTAEK